MKLEGNKKSCIQPMPPIIVSCRDKEGNNNALVVGYACNCSYAPPMLMVGIVPTRHSYNIIKETGCFVVNIAAKENKALYDYMGKNSGKNMDKFSDFNVNFKDGDLVNAPLLLDCPINIECSVVNSILTGSHEMFIGKVEKVHVDEKFADSDANILFDSIELLRDLR